MNTQNPGLQNQAENQFAPLGVLSVLGLAACGGEGGAEVVSSATASEAPGTGFEKTITAQQAALFLQQAQFSSSDEEILSVRNVGYEAWLNRQLAMPQSGLAWDYSMKFKKNQPQGFTGRSADQVLWHKLIESPDAVRQRIVLALSEWFVVSHPSFNRSCFAAGAYWDMLSTHALGNFRNLLEAVTLSWCMGSYLNMRGNLKSDPATGREPDQNYAREIMQLFTIGLYELNLDGTPKLDTLGKPLETYDQDTVVNLAKVFTGWMQDSKGDTKYETPLRYRNPMIFAPGRHETSQAKFLGTTIAANTDGRQALKMALDTLFNHPNVGPFFGKFLIQRLVTSNPSPAYVARVAKAFNNNGQGVRGDMKALVKAVVLDPEARNPAKRNDPAWGKLREPIVRVVQWARTFNAYSTAPQGEMFLNDLSSNATGLGQSPLRASSVFNFFRPGYVPPNTRIAKQKLVAPEFQITDQTTVASYINVMEELVGNQLQKLVSNYASEIGLVHDVAALLARLNLLLAANRLSTQTLATISSAVKTVSLDQPDGAMKRVKTAVFLVMVSPDYLVQN